MTFPSDPHERSPKGHHNRRLALGLELEDFAAQAGLTVGELREYEFTPPDGHFEISVAQRVGEVLERLERIIEPGVNNSASPLAYRAEDDPPIVAMGTATYKVTTSK